MKVVRSSLLPYSARDMYQIVADIEAYPSFLNWCQAADIISHSSEEVIASMRLSYAKLNIQFTTRNLNNPGESIRLQLVEGPFSSLEGLWTFQALSPQACKVAIEMDFHFDNSIARRTMNGVFKKVITMQLNAFQQRAQTLHGGDRQSQINA